MQDSNEFYTNFCCKIEESLKNINNKAKRQYTAFFQKTIEIEDELSGTS